MVVVSVVDSVVLPEDEPLVEPVVVSEVLPDDEPVVLPVVDSVDPDDPSWLQFVPKV